jgi:hypothetical protein
MVEVANALEESFPSEPARPRPKPSLVSGSSELARHERKCTICHHSDRAAIEEEFLHWRSPASISRIYNIKERAVYRHAFALGLDKRRRRNARFSLSHIMEQSSTVEVTANVIIRGVRAFTHLTDDGEWIEPPKVRRPRKSAIAVATASISPSDWVESENLIDRPNRERNAATR